MVVIKKESAKVEAMSKVVREVANDKAAKCQVCLGTSVQQLQVSTYIDHLIHMLMSIPQIFINEYDYIPH